MANVFANHFEVNMTLCKIPYADNYKFKILKCIWNPNQKQWCKKFSKKYYPSFDNQEYLDMINRFLVSCLDHGIRIEYIEGLEDLKESVFKNRGQKKINEYLIVEN
jgi:hypothetical protein